MPDCFVQSPEGLLYNFNGQDAPTYWNGRYTQFRESGVGAPTTTPAITGSGSGNILGRFYCYVRYVDEFGNFSNLSPRSTVYEALSSSIEITNISYGAPMVVTTAQAHGLATGQSILIKDVRGNDAANGEWTVTVLTSTTFELDGSTPSWSYTGGGLLTTGVSEIQYSSVMPPQDSKIVRRQILRNKDGNTAVFYVDIDTENLTSTTFSSQKTSLELSDPVALFDDTGVDNALAIYSPAPDYKAVAAHLKGRMFALVDEDDDQGCLSLVQGSTTVTGINTHFRSTYPGRYLDVPGAPDKYLIESVESSTSLTLADPYMGDTDPYANYVIRTNDSEHRTVYWTLANKPEAWPDDALRTLQEDPGAGRLTGAMPMANYLFLTAQNRLYRLTYVNDPGTDSSIPAVVTRGCISNRMHVTVDGTGFLLDKLGVYVFTGSDSDPRVGNAVSELFRSAPLGNMRINWRRQRFFHAVLEPNEGVIRWFVCLDGNWYPRHALCMHYRSARWWIEEFPFPVASSCLGVMNGRQQVFIGSRLHRILALESGNVDGPQTGTLAGTVTSAGRNWIQVTDPPSDAVGYPVSITGGRGKGQQRTVIERTSTRLTVDRAWLIQPDSTSSYMVGGIKYAAQTLWFELAEGSDEVNRSVAVQIRPEAAESQMDVRIYRDFSGTPMNQGATQYPGDHNGIGANLDDPDLELSTTKTQGYFQHRLDGFKAWGADGNRFTSIELRGVTGTDRTVIRMLRIDGLAR